MDQIVFIFDLEQMLPLKEMVGELEDSLLQARMNSIKQAALRIVTYCTEADRITENRRDLPSFGFRWAK